MAMAISPKIKRRIPECMCIDLKLAKTDLKLIIRFKPHNQDINFSYSNDRSN